MAYGKPKVKKKSITNKKKNKTKITKK